MKPKDLDILYASVRVGDTALTSPKIRVRVFDGIHPEPATTQKQKKYTVGGVIVATHPTTRPPRLTHC